MNQGELQLVAKKSLLYKPLTTETAWPRSSPRAYTCRHASMCMDTSGYGKTYVCTDPYPYAQGHTCCIYQPQLYRLLKAVLIEESVCNIEGGTAPALQGEVLVQVLLHLGCGLQSKVPEFTTPQCMVGRHKCFRMFPSQKSQVLLAVPRRTSVRYSKQVRRP